MAQATVSTLLAPTISLNPLITNPTQRVHTRMQHHHIPPQRLLCLVGIFKTTRLSTTGITQEVTIENQL
eukprot:m.59014 g.59014  ORF g.59014 m.59014 type:complete len:69 (-) comp13198_c0_seq1:620-826(-)